jgi:hypothetical protein
MAIIFDGTTKIITLSTGTIVLSITDLYSRWKDWILLSDNSKYSPAFSVVGGDIIDNTVGTAIPLYAFLLNGWRIKPQEANHTLSVTNGVILVEGGGDPFINTDGSFVIRINYQQPVQAINIGANDPAEAVWADMFSNGLTARDTVLAIQKLARLAATLSAS